MIEEHWIKTESCLSQEFLRQTKFEKKNGPSSLHPVLKIPTWRKDRWWKDRWVMKDLLAKAARQPALADSSVELFNSVQKRSCKFVQERDSEFALDL